MRSERRSPPPHSICRCALQSCRHNLHVTCTSQPARHNSAAPSCQRHQRHRMVTTQPSAPRRMHSHIQRRSCLPSTLQPQRHRRATAACQKAGSPRCRHGAGGGCCFRAPIVSARRLLLPCADCERDGSNPAVHGPRLRADCAVCECSSRNGLSLRIAAHSMVAVRLVRSSAASLAADSPAWQLDGAHTSHTNAAAALPSSDATTTAEPPRHSLAARQALRRRPRVARTWHILSTCATYE